MENVNIKFSLKTQTNNCFNLTSYLASRQSSPSVNQVKQVSKNLFETAKDFYQKDLWAHFGCVNAIEFSNDGNLLFSGGDDRRALMWDVNNSLMYNTHSGGTSNQPTVMKATHYSNIFCMAIDDVNKKLLSGGNDDQVIVHDYNTLNPVDYFLHNSPVFALSLCPQNGNIFATASDEGRISIYDLRESNTAPLCLVKFRSSFHGVKYNPAEPQLLATAHSKVGVHVWDIRKPKEFLVECSKEQSMAVRWNDSGTMLLALRNLLPPVLYDITTPNASLEFDSDCYFNACTMKSCTFAGVNDEYIVSGSDDFNLYMWKIPDPWPASGWVNKTHLVLSGHRSIVNQVRYCPKKQIIATSGVEKIIKLWSPLRTPHSSGDRDVESPKVSRRLCSYLPCYSLSTLTPHDYSQELMTEDRKMIHFFDSLLREQLNPTHLIPTELWTMGSKKNKRRPYAVLIKQKIEHLHDLLVESDGTAKCCSLKQKVEDKTSTEAVNKRYYFSSEVNGLVSASDDDETHLLVTESSSSSQSGPQLAALSSSSSSVIESLQQPTSSSTEDDNFTNSFNFKDSGINVSELPDSDGDQEPVSFKKKKISSNKRNYRKRKSHSDLSDSSDSNKNCKRKTKMKEKWKAETSSNDQITSTRLKQDDRDSDDTSSDEINKHNLKRKHEIDNRQKSKYNSHNSTDVRPSCSQTTNKTDRQRKKKKDKNKIVESDDNLTE